MISFVSDYSEGAHPLILERLSATNMCQEPGYGLDSFSEAAREKVRKGCQCPEADVFFLSGGTQTNATVIDSLLKGYEGVVAAATGHVAVHEAGAIEASGHKVLTVPAHDGKMDAGELEAYLEAFFADSAYDHMVFPGMVYISFPTEYGTIYSAAELSAIHDVCRKYSIPLYIDGARLGYGLASEACDLTLPGFAALCDVFYIGGTKVGALCGEAVVFPRGNAPAHFFTTVKQHGALLAKGRLLGVQFETLFTDGLYLEISRAAVEKAMEMKAIFRENGIPLKIDSPTNQQFPVLSPPLVEKLRGKVQYEVWENLPDGGCVARFATSWATPQEHIDMLRRVLNCEL